MKNAAWAQICGPKSCGRQNTFYQPIPPENVIQRPAAGVVGDNGRPTPRTITGCTR